MSGTLDHGTLGLLDHFLDYFSDQFFDHLFGAFNTFLNNSAFYGFMAQFFFQIATY